MNGGRLFSSGTILRLDCCWSLGLVIFPYCYGPSLRLSLRMVWSTNAYGNLLSSPHHFPENRKIQTGSGNLKFSGTRSQVHEERVAPLLKVVHLAEIYKEVHELLSRISNRFDGRLRKPFGSGVFPGPNVFLSKNLAFFPSVLLEKLENRTDLFFPSPMTPPEKIGRQRGIMVWVNKHWNRHYESVVVPWTPAYNEPLFYLLENS